MKINVLLSAAKCVRIPPYLKSAICLYVTFVSHCVYTRGCQQGEGGGYCEPFNYKIPPGVSKAVNLLWDGG